jgi:RNA polymerase subunit RPABC4/transcription elongation factor Spt4
MALIECKECRNQVSDTAAACPKCGAVVPVTIGPDQEQCPHCMALVSKDASTCPNCRAVKGYMYEPRYGVIGKIGVILWGLIVPIGLTIAIPVVGILLIPFALYALFRLITGPRWFQSKHV